MTNVFVNHKPVGRLTRENFLNRFSYNDNTTASLAVSLLMPVSESSYLSERETMLHPVFDMNLPEGPLREALANMFSKTVPIFDDLALLDIVGRSLIGRLRFGLNHNELDLVPPQNLRELINYKGTEDLFRDLLIRYARYSGVAGVQPKLLIRDDKSLNTLKLNPVESGARLTTNGTTHIVKTFDPIIFPGLATNEYLCLQAAKNAGLVVPNAELSNNGRMIIIERFDLKPNGQYLAFEDGCAITGMVSRDKYMGSYEQLAGSIGRVLLVKKNAEFNLGQFFRSLVLSVLVRNGDAHRKNFGVLYDDATSDVWLAPTYDVITSSIYIPSDTLALTWDGSKRWPNRKRLEQFGIKHCLLNPTVANSIIEEVIEATTSTANNFHKILDSDTNSTDVVTSMKKTWIDAVKTMLDKK